MTRLLSWVAVVLCLLLWAAPVAAQSAGEAPGACAIEDSHGYLGLNASDPFPAGQVVLTFDDGPQPLPTKRLLDLLDRHHYRATFFIVGVWVRPETYGLIQRMVQAGHELGTHTYSHDEYLTRRNWGVDYIEGQYRLTHLLVELALLATSADDFKALYARVFGRTFGWPLTPEQVRASWHGIEQNHMELLAERGHDAEHRVYPMLFARPPGGMPYMGRWPAWMRQQHEAALRRLGMITVLWHGISGDTLAGRGDDLAFLLANVRYHTRKGGILLMHDRMLHEALAQALSQLERDRRLQVVTLPSVVARKYACQAPELYAALRPAQQQPGALAATTP
jgi:peptidoglycan/xylan/chitin deacetylase (PgdA/CDA1 family)